MLERTCRPSRAVLRGCLPRRQSFLTTNLAEGCLFLFATYSRTLKKAAHFTILRLRAPECQAVIQREVVFMPVVPGNRTTPEIPELLANCIWQGAPSSGWKYLHLAGRTFIWSGTPSPGRERRRLAGSTVIRQGTSLSV